MSNKSRIIAGVLLIAAVLAVSFFYIQQRAHSLPPEGVKEVTLTPTVVAILHVDLGRASKATSYEFQKDGDQYHLYFRKNGTLEKVVGDMPKFTDKPDFGGFTDVVSPAGTITYAFNEKYETAFLGGLNLVASDLYALKGNRVEKILSNIEPVGINSLDRRILLRGAYLDQRNNLYALTLNATLCVIRDGQVVGKADVSKIGAKRPAIPSMFSDADNTYFLVPKLADRDNSMTGYGPVGESQIKGKYKINF